jgi:glycosyltransferase involved in cell wall biosynthesis
MRRLGIDARKLGDFGVGSYLQGLLRELAALDPLGGLVVLVSRESLDLLPALPDSWRLVEVEARGYTVREQLAVLSAALRSGVGLLHTPHYVFPLLYPHLLVVSVHDIIHVLFPEFLPHSLGFFYARTFIHAAVRRAQRVITGSETTAHDLKRLFGADVKRVEVIPQGVSEEFLAPGDPAGEAEIRTRLGLPNRYLLHVGNHKPHKNAEGLLKAYQLLVFGQRVGLPPLVLAGGFRPDGPLAARARAMGLGGRVVCLGYLEQHELMAVYRGATAFVYPTLYEGFGLSVLEAMACGVPVVAGDVGAVAEIAGDSVLRVNPRDLEELAHAIRRLLESRDLQSRLGERGRLRAQQYRWRRTAEATLQVYRAVEREA